jgi:hypothetical protein
MLNRSKKTAQDDTFDSRDRRAASKEASSSRGGRHHYNRDDSVAGVADGAAGGASKDRMREVESDHRRRKHRHVHDTGYSTASTGSKDSPTAHYGRRVRYTPAVYCSKQLFQMNIASKQPPVVCKLNELLTCMPTIHFTKF